MTTKCVYKRLDLPDLSQTNNRRTKCENNKSINATWFVCIMLSLWWWFFNESQINFTQEERTNERQADGKRKRKSRERQATASTASSCSDVSFYLKIHRRFNTSRTSSCFKAASKYSIRSTFIFPLFCFLSIRTNISSLFSFFRSFFL